MLSIAIVSDLHAYDVSTGDPPSHYCVRDPETFPDKHPIAGLLHLVHKEDLAVDLLLSPGDLGDRADPVGIKTAWDALHRVKNALKAKECIGTAGNHDLDSRFKNSGYDARGYLQSLRPTFPVSDDRECDRYWSRHFAIMTTDHATIVVLNSCAFHGNAAAEIEHGRVSEATLAALQARIAELPPTPYNILLCHHHPQHQMEIGLGEMDTMRGGQLLVDALGSGTNGRWLVVHGHKHFPKITYAAGSSFSPVVLSSASLSVSLYPALQTRTRNQFHVIRMDDEGSARLGLAGTVQSWDWASGIGWKPANGGAGLPPLAGFGFRGSVEALAREIDGKLIEPKITWQALIELLPDVMFLLPQDFAGLQHVLAQRHAISIVSNDGYPIEIGRGD